MSFSTSKVTVQWSLRFEFFTTPEGTDPARYASVLNICMLEQCSHLHIFANFFHEDVVLVSFSNWATYQVETNLSMQTMETSI
jgi:hypothetical protein